MRVRIALAVAMAALGASVLVTLSRRVEVTAGADHIVSAVFAATLPQAGVLCQISPYLPPGAAAAQIVIGNFSKPLPPIALAFTDPAGRLVASGSLPGGGHDGPTWIPIRLVGDANTATKVCVHVAGHSPALLAGEYIPPDPGDETVNGQTELGRISLFYHYAGGPRSWWSWIGTLDRRLGLGKAPFFGNWTLPACVLVLLGAWALAARALLRADS